MSCFRKLTAVLLILLMPIQGFTMARMLNCEPAFGSEAQVAQSVGHQQADQHVLYSASGTDREHQAQDHWGGYSSSPSDDHDCVSCSLCAMCGSMVVTAAISFVIPVLSSPKPQGLFTALATYFPDSPLHIPVIGAT